MRLQTSLTLTSIMFIIGYCIFTVHPVFAETPIGQNAIQVQTAMDNDGNIHLVYTAHNFGAVYYMKYDGSTWYGPTYLPGSGQTWIPFSYPDIAVGPDGKAQVVYGNVTGSWPHDFDYFYYAKATDVNGTGWDVTTIGNDGKRRAYYDIAVDEYNQPHIVYEMTGTNSSPPFTSAITYRAPDGTETNLVWYPDDAIEAKNPCIYYGNNQVHIAWFAGGLSIYRNELYYGVGSSENFSTWQITYNDYGTFDYPPEIGINPVTGEVIVTYLSSHWEGFEGGITGVYWVNPYGGSGTIDGEFISLLELEWEDQAPQIGFSNDGTRYVAYSFISRNKCLYKIGPDSADRVEISPYGFIDIAAGNGAYYVRPHTPLPSPPDVPSPGPLYFEELAGGGPVYYPPTAEIVDISPNPVLRGIHFAVDFDGDAWDNDENGNSIVAWEWSSSANGVLGTTEDITVNPIDLDVGRQNISFKAQDNEGEWSNTVTTFLFVLPDTIPPPAVMDAACELMQDDTVRVSWSGVTDNLGMDYYEIYRGNVAWFEPDQPVAQVAASPFPMSYDDGEAFLSNTEVYYLVVPVDIDGNANWDGTRPGAAQYQLDIE